MVVERAVSLIGPKSPGLRSGDHEDLSIYDLFYRFTNVDLQ